MCQIKVLVWTLFDIIGIRFPINTYDGFAITRIETDKILSDFLIRVRVMTIIVSLRGFNEVNQLLPFVY